MPGYSTEIMRLILIGTFLLFFGVNLILGGDISSKRSIFDHLTEQYSLKDGRHIFVFDGVIPEEYIMALNIFMSTNDNWRYVLPDIHSGRNATLYDSGNGIPWKSWKDPAVLAKTNVGLQLKNLIQAIDAETHDGRQLSFRMNEIYAGLIRRGDRTKLHQEATAEENSYSIAIYMNVVWRKNAYGELFFYDEDGEIFAPIRHKFGRIVVWDSSITYVFRPPSISQLATQGIIVSTFSADERKNIQKLTYFQKFLTELHNPPYLNNWIGHTSKASSLDFNKHMTLYRENRNGHFVAVFDGLFDESSLSLLRSWVIKYGTYFFDGSIDVDSDNVQWIAGINVDDFVHTQFWPVIKRMSQFVTKNDTDWYPYDVACNLIRTHDHTRFHLDTSHSKEKEMTFLLYLSPNWTAADYGETAFMETNDNAPDNEYVAEVVPMYGRAVIFNGHFPHSARPPSVMHYDARYTFAVKLSYTKLLAVRKTFDEEFKHEGSLVSSFSSIMELTTNPRKIIAQHKIEAVAEHLSSRHLQKILGEQNVEEEKSDDDEMNDRNEIHLGSNEDESEFERMRSSLPSSERKLLQKMEKYHNVASTNKKSGNDPQLEELKPFDEERRKKSWKKWNKISGNAPDKVNDYLELYLKQRTWLKNHIGNKVVAIL
ncbi:uncharacterized protein LOC120333637 [Styela clava]